MEGSKQDPGINYRAMKELFRSACMSVDNPFTSGNVLYSCLIMYDEVDNTGGQTKCHLQLCEG